MLEVTHKPFCACSTPVGIGGIAVIRVSGDGSGSLIDNLVKIIRSADDVQSFSQMRGYTLALADFFDPKTHLTIDRVIIGRFEAPHSYTGQEMAEISCHGGNAVKQEILRVLLENGFRAAQPGEFTKTAFYNGKLDLTSAEAVMSVIAADSERALLAANSQMNGKLSKRLSSTEEKLYKVLSLIEMIVEFPEHDDTPENEENIKSILCECQTELQKLVDSYGTGRILAQRMRIALCGLPNSGKSSLLNCMSGYDRAIVTETPGTTRDTLEVSINVAGIPVTLIDTAGIRDTEDTIEAMGVDRAKSEFANADMVLYLISPTASLESVTAQLEQICKAERAGRVTILFSKCDSGRNQQEEQIKAECKARGIESFLSVSSTSEINIDSIQELIADFFEKQGAAAGDVTLMNSRHYERLNSALECLNMAIDALDGNLGVDVASSVLRSSLDSIGEITGKTVSAELVDTIFSKFCIGK